MKIFNFQWTLGLLICCLVVDLFITGYIGFWRNVFWSSVENRDLLVFSWYLGYFVIAALMGCFVSGQAQYLINYLGIAYRYRLTRGALKLNYDLIEGGRQRVQEDCANYPLLVLNLGYSAVRNLVLITIFSIIILLHLEWYYLLFPFVYVIIGTVFAKKIAKPLIFLNYLNQTLEARFRQTMMKLDYSKVHRNCISLFRTTKKLQYFQVFFNQITVIIPFLVLSVVYFAKKITFGTLMQCTSAMGSVIESSSFFINSFNDINRLLSCRKRLQELTLI